jgi:putative membrane protein
MIQDHTKTSHELKAFVQNGTVKADIPTSFDYSHQKKMDALTEADGANFAGTYINDQTTAHKDAVDLFERYAKGGDNDTLKQWASQTLPTLRRHLEMAESLTNAGARHESENKGSEKGASAEATGRSAYDNPAADPSVAPSDDPAFSGERPSGSPAFTGQPTPTGQTSKSKP